MPCLETLERFIARVEENAHVQAVEEFYAADATMRENQDPPRTGRELQVARERGMLSRVATMTSKCVRPAFVSGDNVAIRWVFHFVWVDGTETMMEEVAWQRWVGERIVDETFFYDPAQRVPKVRSKT